MSYNLNSLKGGYIVDYIGEYHRATKGDRYWGFEGPPSGPLLVF